MELGATERSRGRAQGSRLLEREAELGRLRGAIGAAREGRGGLVLIAGPAGIGKTSLLRVARDRARRDDMIVLTARGRELERDFPFGVARQLYEPELRAAEPDRRATLLDGAAGLAGPLLVGSADGGRMPALGGDDDPSFGLVHGLYWLTANLAEERPALIIVDDLHWADLATLRLLIYLGARLVDLPVLVVLAIRTGESVQREALLAALDDEATTIRMAPGSLSDGAVRELVSAGLGPEPEPAFCAACARVTGGNPFLLGELIAELRDEGVTAAADAVAHVQRVRPAAVARTVLLRLLRLGAEAQQLAEAVAILEKAQLRDAAELAALDLATARTACDRLFATQILTSPPTLSFLHPLLRDAVYEGIAPAARRDGHRRAALLLGGPTTAAGQDSLGAHLLRGETAGDPQIAALCRQAAHDALSRGEPATAARLLGRALAEPPPESERSVLLGELGEAQALARDPAAEGNLRRALDGELDPVTRMRLIAVLVQSLAWGGQGAEAHALVSAELQTLPAQAPLALRVVLETLRAGIASVNRELIASVEGRLDELHALAVAAGPAGASLLIAEGCVRAQRGPWAGPWRELLDAGVGNAHSGGGGLASSPMLDYAAVCLVFGDEVARAQTLLDAMERDAVARGSIRGYLTTVTWRSVLALRTGRLAEAEEGARTALELARHHEILWTVLWATAALTHALLELGRLEEAAATVTAAPVAAAVGSSPWLHVTLARTRTAIAAGRGPEVVADLRELGERSIIDNPSYVPWRSALAAALGPGAEAAAIAAAELSRARELGQPRGIARALRTSARAGAVDPILALEEAIGLLRQAPARLGLAQALCELGEARRRAGQRVIAREALREAAELARVCGATPVFERATDELAASGARSRRSRFAGPEALTPSERRVAELAASGLTNRAIAQALFVTTKTVSTHLGHIYGKLDLAGPQAREQLGAALASAPGGGPPVDG